MPLHPTGRSLSAILGLRDFGPSWPEVSARIPCTRAPGDSRPSPGLPAWWSRMQRLQPIASRFGRAGVHPCYSDARLRSIIRGDAGSTSILLMARLRSTIWVFLKLYLTHPRRRQDAEPRGVDRPDAITAVGSVDHRSARKARNLTNIEEPRMVTSHYLKHEGGPGPLGRKPEVA